MTYSKIVKNVIFPAAQLLLGGRSLEYINEWERTQWLPPSELRALQLRKLRAMLAHCAASVPYYRDEFRRVGFRPEDVASLADLKRLPVLDKSILRAHSSSFIAEGITEKLYIAKTGGSTGEPLSFPIGASLRACSTANMVRCRRWWGIDVGDPSANFWGHSRTVRSRPLDPLRKSLSTFKGRLLNRIVCSAYDLSDSALHSYWRRVDRFRPSFLIGYATSLYVFADFVLRHNLDGPSLRLKAVISTAEVLYDWQAETIRRAFASPVVNEYGMCEAGIIAYQCPSGSMHAMDESVIVEILPIDGSPSGEIVITELENVAAPLIRYNTKDVASAVGAPCPCGRGLSTISNVEGRAYDLIYASNGKIVAGARLTHLMKSTPGVAQYQILQRDLTHLDISFTEYSPVSESDLASVTRTLKNHLGDGVDIKLERVSALPKDLSGKHRWLRSLIRPEDLRPRKEPPL